MINFKKLLASFDSLTDLQEDLKNKLSGGEENFSAYKYIQSKNKKNRYNKYDYNVMNTVNNRKTKFKCSKNFAR